MTVWTDQPDIAELIVFAISVDVIKLERNVPTKPFGTSAIGAQRCKHAFRSRGDFTQRSPAHDPQPESAT